MFYSYLIAFFSLVAISLFFNLFKKFRDSKNVFIHALRFVPITCALMSLAFWLGILTILFVLGFLSLILGSENIVLVCLGVVLLVMLPIFILIGGIAILRDFMHLNLKKYISLAYISVFIGSGVFGTAIYPALFILEEAGLAPSFIFWDKINVDNRFYYENRRLPFIFDEHLLRLGFNSGKVIDIEMDMGGANEFKVYTLKNSQIFMEGVDAEWQPSYIIDTKLEKVYMISDIIHLDKHDYILVKKELVAELLESRTFLGDLDVFGFRKSKTHKKIP